MVFITEINLKMKHSPTFEESLAQLQEALHDQAGDIGVRFEAVFTHLIDISNFYLVPINRYKLLHILEKPGNIMSDYSEHATVIYFSPQLGRHVRGKINLVKPDKSCDIFAMDYGVLDAGVTPEKIFDLLHPEAQTVPGLAILCELSMCYPREGSEFTGEAQESFKFFMGPKLSPLLATVIDANTQKSSVLVMTSNSNPDDVSTSLAYSNHTRLYGLTPF